MCAYYYLYYYIILVSLLLVVVIWPFTILFVWLQMPHMGPPQGPYLPMPLPPSYNRTSLPDSTIYSNPYGGYYSYSTLLEDTPGVCEALLVFAAILLWLYSFYRLYLVWQNTLNFSEASIQGPQGWDLLVSWIYNRIRVKQIQVCDDACDDITHFTDLSYICKYNLLNLYLFPLFSHSITTIRYQASTQGARLTTSWGCQATMLLKMQHRSVRAMISSCGAANLQVNTTMMEVRQPVLAIT